MKSALSFVYKWYQWTPVIFLGIIWYIPRNTAPGGIFEEYLFLRWITLLLIPVWGAVQLAIQRYQRIPIRLPPVILPLIVFSAVLAVSCGVHRTPVLQMCGVALFYLRYPLLFLILVNMDLPRKLPKVFFRMFAFLLLIQIPECFYRFWVLGISGDRISWSMGPWGTFGLGVYMTYFTALVVSRSVRQRLSFLFLLTVLCFFAGAVIGEIKAFLFAAPIITVTVAVFALYPCRRGKAGRVAVVLFFVCSAAVLSVRSWSTVHAGRGDAFTQVTAGERLSLGYRLNYERRKAKLEAKLGEEWWSGPVIEMYSRVRSLPVVGRRAGKVGDFVLDIRHEPLDVWLGLGPGASFAGHFWEEKGALHGYPAGRGKRNQLIALVADAGLLGLAVYFWFLFLVLRKILAAYAIRFPKPVCVLSAAAVGMWVFYALLGPFYNQVWRYDASSYVFFFYAAVIWRYWYESGSKERGRESTACQ
ncbi:MAG: hypothetical protein GF333_04310 [Candidatus Omnitrophica bacterium]|nr:hypothetical protein [Candidatus Omnitrophota bacterium]